ncbi:MAG: protein kinase, partial [Solirubrobacterales bacterium]|nr:protein kinase [Solirubrobacterales bacterium]
MRDITADTVIDGRYQVIGKVGSGGMAEVYGAEDLQLGRKVAVKVLHRRFTEDEEFVERFRREAQSAAGLQHPNVVGVFDRGEWDGTSYIAMEYVHGRTKNRIEPEEVGQAMKPSTAQAVTEMMGQVVKEGTGTAAALQGIEVAGKTGTAEKNVAQ